MRLARTIRFDQSDVGVFPRAAEPGEWAVSGAFLFGDVMAGELRGKLRQAFANGFLGAASLGHATFVVVANAREQDREHLVQVLTEGFHARLGAPDEAAAREAAESEVAHVLELCRDLEPGTVLAVTREREAEGDIRETFRQVPSARQLDHDVRIWTGAEPNA
jgi:hypothetical protein